MKRSDTSSSWRRFVKEIRAKCKEQDIPSTDLVKWIRTSIEQIEKKEFDYYITSGQTPKFPKQKLDADILLGNFLYGFTIFQDKKEYNVFPLKSFIISKEETSNEFISVYFYYTESRSLLIEDKVANSAKLSKFAQRISNQAWR